MANKQPISTSWRFSNRATCMLRNTGFHLIYLNGASAELIRTYTNMTKHVWSYMLSTKTKKICDLALVKFGKIYANDLSRNRIQTTAWLLENQLKNTTSTCYHWLYHESGRIVSNSITPMVTKCIFWFTLYRYSFVMDDMVECHPEGTL